MSDVLLKPGQEDLVTQLVTLHAAYMHATKLAEARRNLIPFCHHMMPEFRSPAHIRAIADLLERAEAGEVTRILITMPPRHGKTRIISNLFPAWYFGRNPGSEVIFTTYNQDLAEDNGRYVKNTIASNEFKEVFPDVRIRNDSASARRFSTFQKGNYFAVGVGGPLTGRGARVLLIDDPLKNREEAESASIRQALIDWYTSTAYTRLAPGGVVIIVQCMTGDTPVLMADGTEKLLRNIRRGDAVATYRDGALSTSRVSNWANHGPDVVYEIRMTSGKIVKANERHPFLVRVGEELKWLRLRDLSPGHEVLRVNGESGRAKPASGTAAINRSGVVATACLTTARYAGRTAFERLRTVLRAVAQGTSSTATASPSKNTTVCTPSRAACARFAGNLRERMSALIGAVSSAWIIATTGAAFAPCFATTATSPPLTSRRPTTQTPLPNTCDFTLDRIEEIRPAGSEDVFDIEVEGTENFIANGLVSHNTRWHTEDLAGVVLQQEHEGWVHLDLPAILDERSAAFLDRKPGEALWPEQFDLDTLLRTKKSIPARDWASLYQQSPVTEGGNIVKRSQVKDWTDPEPPYCQFIIASFDTAFGTKSENDPTAMTVWGLFHDANDVQHAILLDARQRRVEFPELKKWIIDCDERHKPDIILVENKASGQSLLQEMRRLQVPVQAYNPGRQDKVARLHACTPLFENGKVWAPMSRDYVQEWIEQLVTFPSAKHDDLVDSTTAALQRLRRFGDLTTAQDYEPDEDESADDNRAVSYW